MAISPANAAAAYIAAARNVPAGTKPGGEDVVAAKSSFMDLIKATAEDAIASNKAAEKISMEAAAGRANATDVVTALAEAEAALTTVVTVRDRVIQAYQEILRMPI